MMYRINKLFLCLLLTPHLHGATLLTGDSAAPAGQSFSFPMSSHAQGNRDAFYVGALNAGAQDFALARADLTSTQFVSMAPAAATVNYLEDVPNPLFNKGIALLDVLVTPQGMGMQDHIMAVTTDPAQISNIYLLDRFSQTAPANVLSVENVKDASGLTTSGILAIAASKSGFSGGFAAVKPNSGAFGAVGSGIALFNFTQAQLNEGGKELTRLFFEQWSAQLGNPAVAAAAFDTTSSFLKITSNLASMTNVVDMVWDSVLMRLYVAIQATGNSGANDGARAVAVGSVVSQNNSINLVFNPIVSSSVFVNGAGNEIVGGLGANSQVSWHKVRVMHTSLGMDYLIGVGGNGSSAATANQVYALPLVNAIDANGLLTPQNAAIQGTLAAVNGTPQALFNSNMPPTFLRRVITTPATTNSQIYTSSSQPAMVGGGPLGAGAITDILVQKDTVFVTVGQPASVTQSPGIFYSQALFNAQGTIQDWTPWRPIGGTVANMFGVGFGSSLGQVTFMTGANAAAINTVQRTQWGTGSPTGLQPMGTMLINEFAQDSTAGMQAFFDFPQNTPGLTNMAMYAATGFKRIVLVESGQQLSGGAFMPNGGTFITSKQNFNSGTISPAAQSLVLSITGGALNNLGAIVTAEIGVAGSQGYIFAGGDGGLAVLANGDGTGFNAATGLTPNFTGLTNGTSFKSIGNYSFVRSLIADGNFLYVLTDSRLDRINMSASNFATNNLSVVTLATAAQFSAQTLMDLVVSGKFGLLSTSAGLYRVGSGSDISTASSQTAVGWTLVPVNESAGSVIHLIALSSTGRSQDVARSGGGNIYAVNGFVGQSAGQVNRFAVMDVSSSAITDSTLQPLPDILVQNIPSFFKTFGGFANQFATDGALYLYSRCQNRHQPPFVKSIQAVLPIKDFILPLNFGGTSTIVRMLHSSASGSWMIMGDAVWFNE